MNPTKLTEKKLKSYSPLTLPLVKKFNLLCEFNEAELTTLVQMHENSMSLDAQTTFLNQGTHSNKSYIVNRGWAYRYNDLSDGSRQIINFYLPGDIINPLATLTPNTAYSVASITPLELCEFKLNAFINPIIAQPRLSLFYAWILSRLDSIMADQTVRIGRLLAYQRTAHLLLEIFHRLEAVGQTKNCTFSMPISQHFLADTLGLSLVHMNRTLKKLRINNLVHIHADQVVLKDIKKLKKIAEYRPCDLAQTENLLASFSNKTNPDLKFAYGAA
ncbi:cAMP-binding domain of CRP or a regulatory subunit of cAMP-dependent protein kinases [Nitrosomonas sp. Nm51]|uniref:Crp/Fnr family transcriptional regulator n=1 Tax=Nitrosomonas sp. Nm51 TaxID=133720 RepID=UPI0008AAF3D8|nr:Crp/Fnr family transcriptional regulator [Nitrosomonas sp. Nm51]SEQ74450.1 cAMP-binding domain of CRP or a regulatory subunit of cAMP-dependent protein kinases [Nitrosomonas sp. Nm51]